MRNVKTDERKDVTVGATLPAKADTAQGSTK